MATKACKRQARELVETLEGRVHAGPPVHESEIQSARDYLRQHDFPTVSGYFSRLALIGGRVGTRVATVQREKRNYGGQAAGRWMQVQSIYDHVILSTCYEGDFNLRHGRVKLSYRFNRAGRVDFVELKLLRSLDSSLDGTIRKLLLVRNYQSRARDWYEAEAHALRVLPRELILIFADVFRSTREEILAWLVNLGHWTVQNLLEDLCAHRIDGCARGAEGNSNQLGLGALLTDEVARPILEQSEGLESTVELDAPEVVVVRYSRT